MVSHAADSLWVGSERPINVKSPAFGSHSTKTDVWNLSTVVIHLICVRHKGDSKVDQAKNNVELSKLPSLGILAYGK